MGGEGEGAVQSQSEAARGQADTQVLQGSVKADGGLLQNGNGKQQGFWLLHEAHSGCKLENGPEGTVGDHCRDRMLPDLEQVVEMGKYI